MAEQSLGNIVLHLSARMDELDKTINQAIGKIQNFSKSSDKSLESFSQKFKTVSKNVAITVAAVSGAITAFGWAIHKLASEASKAQEAELQFEQALKTTGGAAGLTKQSLLELAKEMQRLTTYEDDVIVEAESLMLTFTKVNKDVFPDAIKLAADLSARFKTDLKSSIIQVGKALNDPILGITALRRTGISFTDEQKKQIKVLMESNRLLDAQKIILKELSIEVGGSAQAIKGTYLGAVASLKNAWGEFKETIGEVLIRTYKLPQILNAIQKGVEGITEALKRNEGPAATFMTWLDNFRLGIGLLTERETLLKQYEELSVKLEHLMDPLSTIGAGQGAEIGTNIYERFVSNQNEINRIMQERKEIRLKLQKIAEKEQESAKIEEQFNTSNLDISEDILQKDTKREEKIKQLVSGIESLSQKAFAIINPTAAQVEELEKQVVELLQSNDLYFKGNEHLKNRQNILQAYSILLGEITTDEKQNEEILKKRNEIHQQLDELLDKNKQKLIEMKDPLEAQVRELEKERDLWVNELLPAIAKGQALEFYRNKITQQYKELIEETVKSQKEGNVVLDELIRNITRRAQEGLSDAIFNAFSKKKTKDILKGFGQAVGHILTDTIAGMITKPLAESIQKAFAEEFTLKIGFQEVIGKLVSGLIGGLEIVTSKMSMLFSGLGKMLEGLFNVLSNIIMSLLEKLIGQGGIDFLAMGFKFLFGALTGGAGASASATSTIMVHTGGLIKKAHAGRIAEQGEQLILAKEGEAVVRPEVVNQFGKEKMERFAKGDIHALDDMVIGKMLIGMDNFLSGFNNMMTNEIGGNFFETGISLINYMLNGFYGKTFDISVLPAMISKGAERVKNSFSSSAINLPRQSLQAFQSGGIVQRQSVTTGQNIKSSKMVNVNIGTVIGNRHWVNKYLIPELTKAVKYDDAYLIATKTK